MEDLFVKEQQTYDSALSHIKEIEDGHPCDGERFRSLTKEYGRLLKQFRRVTKLSDKAQKKLILHEIELRNQAVHDALTGIYNRRFLDDALVRYVGELYESQQPLTVLMIDVDCFKLYNDTYGHSMGDDCLKAIADTLSGSIRADDGFAARYGGEEFTVILPRANQIRAKTVSDRLVGRIVDLAIPHKSSPVTDIVTVSIGYTSGVPDGRLTAEDFIERADKALYLSKQNGRNQSTFS
jgi:diguanylate cyclase (GGDEF)-like protein